VESEIVIHQYRGHGIETWSLNGEYHRENGPAYIDTLNGYKAWRIHGKRHRIDGPAVINANGIEEWWVDNKRWDLKDIPHNLELQQKYPELVMLALAILIHEL
jgi:hypothetical protein